MMLRRLILERYGHLSGVELAFSGTPDLHIVLGANEAGKSTALSAIGDALFRFPDGRTPFGFLHRDLRVGVTLRARDGREQTFFRRKGRAGNDLFDGADRPLPEAAIAVFLHGVARKRFEDVFGLTGAALRDGGKSILQGKGDAGEAILGAATGFHRLRDAVARLDDDAGRLFGDKRGRREFHEAAQCHRDAQRRRDEARIDHTAWKSAEDEVEALEDARAEAQARMQDLHAERTRLSRVRGTSPGRRAITLLLAQRATLGAVPDLPADAESRHHAAVEALLQADRDLARESQRLEALDHARAALPEHAPILSLAERIDVLRDNAERIAGAMSDREERRLEESQHTAAMLDEGRRLGHVLDADALSAAIPTVMAREAVTNTLKRHNHLSGQHLTTTQALADATARLQEATQGLGALPALEPSAELRAAIDFVRGEGRLDTARSDAETALAAATTALMEALAALPLWAGDAAALAVAPLPLDPAIDRCAASLHSAAADIQAAELALKRRDEELAELEAAIRADAAAGPLPTREAIAAARSRRDAAWALIRRAHLDGGPAISADERDGVRLGADVAAGFEALVQEADRLVDRRAEEQERVVEAEQRVANRARQRAMREMEAQVHDAATARQQAALEAWRTLWRPAGIIPDDDPAVMRDWLRQRAQVLAALQAQRDARAKLDSLDHRHREAFGTLAALLPAHPATATGSVASLLRAAEGACKAREQAEAAHAKSVAEVTAVTRAVERAQKAAAAIGRELSAWREDWAQAAAGIALPADADPDTGTAALDLWTRIEAAHRERRIARERIDQMTQSIGAFDAEAASIVARLAPDLADHGSLDAISVLAERLTRARADANERQRLGREAGEVRHLIETSQRSRQCSQDALDHLRCLSGAPDDDVLRQTLARWTTHRDLTAKIDERQRDLDLLNDGKTLEELAAEADGIDPDTLPARIEAIDADLKRLQGDAEERAGRLRDLRRTMADMEKGNDAAAAQQDMEAALAEMDDVATRYVPLRMAGVLLRAGIERYRQRQQDPLLRRAGALFRDLTEGRYTRLDTEEDDKGVTHVVACRPDNTVCPADRLSEGTRDQLYLALRLAAIEIEARATEPLPFIGDDLLVNFDDRRARAALRVLADFASVTQVILFTHHDHIADLARAERAQVHRLDVPVGVM